MSRKLISDLPRLLRVMFVTCLIFSNFYEKSRRNIVFVFLRFVSSKIGLHSKMLVFSKFFYPIFRFGS